MVVVPCLGGDCYVRIDRKVDRQIWTPRRIDKCPGRGRLSHRNVVILLCRIREGTDLRFFFVQKPARSIIIKAILGSGLWRWALGWTCSADLTLQFHTLRRKP